MAMTAVFKRGIIPYHTHQESRPGVEQLRYQTSFNCTISAVQIPPPFGQVCLLNIHVTGQGEPHVTLSDIQQNSSECNLRKTKYSSKLPVLPYASVRPSDSEFLVCVAIANLLYLQYFECSVLHIVSSISHCLTFINFNFQASEQLLDSKMTVLVMVLQECCCNSRVFRQFSAP